MSPPSRHHLIVWTADCSATVDLTRCRGPQTGQLHGPPCWTPTCDACGERRLDLSISDHKATLYECVLSAGTSFDIYRWINLADLKELWPRLRLPFELRAEWRSALDTVITDT